MVAGTEGKGTCCFYYCSVVGSYQIWWLL